MYCCVHYLHSIAQGKQRVCRGNVAGKQTAARRIIIMREGGCRVGKQLGLANHFQTEHLLEGLGPNGGLQNAVVDAELSKQLEGLCTT